LAELNPESLADQLVAPAQYEPLAGLTMAEVNVVTALLERRQFRPGEIIVQLGAPAGELFFLARGRVSVSVPLLGGAQKRLAAFTAGMAFGEMALLDKAPRSAVVSAETDVECDLLRRESFEQLEETHPRIKIILLRNLALGLSSRLRKANREISVFDY
jgi:glutaminase